MNEDKFNALVAELEEYERQHPAGYKLRLALLALLGYFYLLFVTTVMFGLVVLIAYSARFNFLVIKFLLIPLGLVGVVLRSLWIQLPEPDGQEITRAEAPALFDLLDDLKKSVGGPHFSRVLVSDQFNASVHQVSRVSFLWPKHYLVLGLPLMHAVSPVDFKSILAHEFGHLSNRRGHFGSWIYRARQTWSQIAVTMHREKRRGSELFTAFLDWYAPFLNAYSFVLARRHEYEADGFSVKVVGQKCAARALVKLRIRERQLEDEFWPAFFRDAAKEPEPPRRPLDQLFSAVERPLSRAENIRWFVTSLAFRTESTDSHPSLADRLAAIGYSRELKPNDPLFDELLTSDEENAAQAYLDSVSENYLATRNRWLREATAKQWRERHDYVQEANKNLEELMTKAKVKELSEDERYQVAVLTAETRGTAAALPVVRQMISTNPEHQAARYLLGQILLEHGDRNGIELIEKAVSDNPVAQISAYSLIEDFLKKNGDYGHAQEYLTRAREQYDKLQKGENERVNIDQRDEFRPHNLADDAIADVQNQLHNFKQVGRAYLVRKLVHYFPEDPLFVLGVIPARPWYRGRSVQAEQALLNVLAENLKFPGRTLIVILEGRHRDLRKALRLVPGAAIV